MNTLSGTQLDCLRALENRARLGNAWSERFDLNHSTPTLRVLVRETFATEHVSRNAWGWFEFAWQITAVGSDYLAHLKAGAK